MGDGHWVEGSYYFYAPNKGAPAFMIFAFVTTGLVHAYQCYRFKCWLFTPFFPFCSLLFAVGFALREYGAFHYDDLPVYIASTCLIFAAPPLLELANFHILGRILYYAPYYSPIHPGRVLSTFAFLSAIVEALNGWGASYSANQSLTDSQLETGHILIKVALILQVFVAAAFLSLATVFHRRCHAGGIASHRNIRQPMITLYTSMAIILARTIFRIVEYFHIASMRFSDPGFDPMTMAVEIRYEWFFYVFEALLMLINMVLWNVRHPRRYLPENTKTYLLRDGVSEGVGPGWEDPRPFWQTWVDPFDLVGLMKGAKSGQGFQNFWDEGVRVQDGDGNSEESRKKSGV